jgi:hypothetical protein
VIVNLDIRFVSDEMWLPDHTDFPLVCDLMIFPIAQPPAVPVVLPASLRNRAIGWRS